MTVDEIIEFTESLGDVITWHPAADDTSVPEIARGDVFFYRGSAGEIGSRSQPFATIVTKTYPGEPASDLDRDGSFRVNIGLRADEFARATGVERREVPSDGASYAVADEVVPHPTYARAGWVSVIDPVRSADAVREMLTSAHARAR